MVIAGTVWFSADGRVFAIAISHVYSIGSIGSTGPK